MPNITSIGAGMYTSLTYLEMPVVKGPGTAGDTIGTGDDPSAWAAEFETIGTPWVAGANAADFGRIREFPNLGIPANIVNVPQYGQAVSSQIAGQSDAPSMDFTFNYVPSEHAFIAAMREDGEKRMFRVRLANAKQAEDTTTGVDLPYIDEDGTLREFSDFYFVGSVASFEIVPNLTDSNQLNVTLTIDGEMQGPFSYDAAAPVYA
jgi:hypothetical protein